MTVILTVPSTMLQISQAQISQSDQNTILSMHNGERNAVVVRLLLGVAISQLNPKIMLTSCRQVGMSVMLSLCEQYTSWCF